VRAQLLKPREGSAEARDVHRRVAERISELVRCFDPLLKREPRFVGTVSAVLNLAPGQPRARVTVLGKADPDRSTCLQAGVERWALQAPKEPILQGLVFSIAPPAALRSVVPGIGN
jgi:hypothetical protein